MAFKRLSAPEDVGRLLERDLISDDGRIEDDPTSHMPPLARPIAHRSCARTFLVSLGTTGTSRCIWACNPLHFIQRGFVESGPLRRILGPLVMVQPAAQRRTQIAGSGYQPVCTVKSARQKGLNHGV